MGAAHPARRKELAMTVLPNDMKQLLEMYEDKKRARKEFITGCIVAIFVIAIFSL